MSANFQDVSRRYHLTILDQCGLRGIDVRHDYRVPGDGRGEAAGSTPLIDRNSPLNDSSP